MQRSARQLMRLAFLAVLLLVGCAAIPGGAEPARLDSQYHWIGQGTEFGGLSGLLMGADGTTLTAISDDALLIEADVIRDQNGRITRVVETARHRLRDPQGVVQADRSADTESLAMLGNDLLISLERRNTIWRFSTPDGLPVEVPVPSAISSLQFNSGIEALASTPDGALLAIPERSGALDRPFPVYRLQNGVWDTDLQILRQPPFLPTGADVGPDGRLYLLERDFTGFRFRIQIRSFAIGATLSDMRHVIAPMDSLDNAEGIDIWRDAQGRLRATLISDDNFRFFQRTLLSEFILPQGD